ncbi:MAG: response regulator transcription factor [Chloroflexaceae bacterium]|nr:response regulator transcription factor [Chloroflexaceae bacterium]
MGHLVHCRSSWAVACWPWASGWSVAHVTTTHVTRRHKRVRQRQWYHATGSSTPCGKTATSCPQGCWARQCGAAQHVAPNASSQVNGKNHDPLLVVDDETEIVKIVQDYLVRAGFRVLTAGDGATALRLARNERPNLLVLDLMLPQIDGLDVMRALRRDPATARLPVIMLTARVEEADRLIGLELGADDSLTKPFSPREVVARVRAVLRRSEAPTEPTGLLHSGELVIDLERRSVRRAPYPSRRLHDTLCHAHHKQ